MAGAVTSPLLQLMNSLISPARIEPTLPQESYPALDLLGTLGDLAQRSLHPDAVPVPVAPSPSVTVTAPVVAPTPAVAAPAPRTQIPAPPLARAEYQQALVDRKLVQALLDYQRQRAATDAGSRPLEIPEIPEIRTQPKSAGFRRSPSSAVPILRPRES